MKKLLIVSLLLALSVSISQAQLLIGGRAAGMGGAGVASTDDITAAYYNPAGLMRSKVLLADLKIDLGVAYTSLEALTSVLSNTTDPSKFMIDNYHNNLSFSGNLAGIIGINLRKIGISVLPIITSTVSKAAESLGGSMVAGGHYDTTLTLGTTFSLPYLPAALDVGVNLKSINGINGAIVATQTSTTTATGTQIYGTGTGMGYDLGILTSFDVPFVSKVAVGAVMRNLSTSYSLSNGSKTAYMNFVTQATTFGAETTTKATVDIDSSTAIGAYTTIPVIGVGVAADVEMTKTDTNTHFGVEYPLLFNALTLRAGMAAGPNLSQTTFGAEVNLWLVKLTVVSIQNAKNSSLTSLVADVTIGL